MLEIKFNFKFSGLTEARKYIPSKVKKVLRNSQPHFWDDVEAAVKVCFLIKKRLCQLKIN